MKVGINARTFGVENAEGAVQVGINQTKQLIQDEEIDVILFGPESVEEVFPQVELDSSGFPNIAPTQLYGVLWERTVVPLLAKRHDIDVLYCPNGNGPISEISCPIVVCVHDVNAQLGMSSWIHQLYRKIAVPQSLRISDTVITVSKFSRDEICRLSSISTSKVKVVNNGLDELFHSESKGDEVDLPDDYILFVGSLNPRKNIERIVDSFKKVRRESDIPHKLILAGPPNRMIFKDINLEQSENIRHVGFLDIHELKYAYENATLFLYPSLYEGFGLPPLEAMACGTAVLASNQPPFSETLGSAAVLVDPSSTAAIADEMKRLLLSEEYREVYEMRGKRKSMEYTWEKAGVELKRILKDAVRV